MRPMVSDVKTGMVFLSEGLYWSNNNPIPHVQDLWGSVKLQALSSDLLFMFIGPLL